MTPKFPEKKPLLSRALNVGNPEKNILISAQDRSRDSRAKN